MRSEELKESYKNEKKQKNKKLHPYVSAEDLLAWEHQVKARIKSMEKGRDILNVLTGITKRPTAEGEDLNKWLEYSLKAIAEMEQRLDPVAMSHILSDERDDAYQLYVEIRKVVLTHLGGDSKNVEHQIQDCKQKKDDRIATLLEFTLEFKSLVNTYNMVAGKRMSELDQIMYYKRNLHKPFFVGLLPQISHREIAFNGCTNDLTLDKVIKLAEEYNLDRLDGRPDEPIYLKPREVIRQVKSGRVCFKCHERSDHIRENCPNHRCMKNDPANCPGCQSQMEYQQKKKEYRTNSDGVSISDLSKEINNLKELLSQLTSSKAKKNLTISEEEPLSFERYRVNMMKTNLVRDHRTIIDSGCTTSGFHVKDYFVDVQEDCNIKLEGAFGVGRAEGKGTAVFKVMHPNGLDYEIVTLKGSHLCAKLDSPLLSQEHLRASGQVDIAIPPLGKTGKSSLQIFRKNQLWFEINPSDWDNLFYVDIRPLSNQEKKEWRSKILFAPRKKAELKISFSEAHQRFGHCGRERLILMLKQLEKDRGYEVTDWKAEDCDTCALVNTKHLPYPISTSEFSSSQYYGVRQLVHHDLSGKMTTQASFVGGYYRSILIDHATNMSFVRIIKEKYEARWHIIDILEYFRNQYGSYPKKVRFDGAGETSRSKEMVDWLKERGIVLGGSPPYTHQTSGKIENYMGLNEKMAVAMMKDANTPLSFWGLASLYASYVHQFLPTNANDHNKSPFEVFEDRKLPDLRHLYPFGCKTVMIIPFEKRKGMKMKSKTLEGVFVGVDQDREAWKVVVGRKIFLTRNCRFFPAKYPMRSKSTESNAVSLWEWEEESILEDIDSSHQGMTSSIQEEEIKELVISDEELSDEDTAESESLSENNDSPLEDLRENGYRLRKRQRVKRTVTPKKEIVQKDGPATVKSRILKQIWRVGIQAEWIPKHVREAIDSDGQWKDATLKEYQDIVDAGCVQLVERPVGVTALDTMVVFGIKSDGRKRPRLVIRGDQESLQVDTYASVIQKVSLKLALTLATINDWDIIQYDVSLAFLYAPVPEGRDIYVNIPYGYSLVCKNDLNNKVWKLKKYIYGLKDAPKAWANEHRKVLEKLGFVRSEVDWQLFSRDEVDGQTLIVVHVDDGLIMGRKDVITEVHEKLQNYFTIRSSDLSLYVGWEFYRDRKNKRMFITVSSYIQKLGSEYGEPPSRRYFIPMNPNEILEPEDTDEVWEDKKGYEKLIGELSYITMVRSDIVLAVNKLSQFTSSPKRKHWLALKRVLWYTVSTHEYGLLIGDLSKNQLEGFSDASYANETKRRSRSGGLLYFYGSLIGSISKCQQVVAQSTTESEYYAMAEIAKLLIFVQNLLKSIKCNVDQPSVVYGDNKGALELTHTTKFQQRSKHIDVRYHAIRYYIEEGRIKIQYVNTEMMIADVLTKPLNRRQFEKFRSLMNIKDVSLVKGSVKVSDGF